MMFETFTVPALLAVNQATLVAIAFNYPTGSDHPV
jgi:actin-related protein